MIPHLLHSELDASERRYKYVAWRFVIAEFIEVMCGLVGAIMSSACFKLFAYFTATQVSASSSREKQQAASITEADNCIFLSRQGCEVSRMSNQTTPEPDSASYSRPIPRTLEKIQPDRQAPSDTVLAGLL